jgi:hypothetical protein
VVCRLIEESVTSLSLSLFLSLSLSFSLCVCVSVSLCVCVSLSLSLSLCVCVCVYVCVCLCVVCLSVCLSAFLSPSLLKTLLGRGDWQVLYCTNPNAPGGPLLRSGPGQALARDQKLRQTLVEPDTLINSVEFKSFGLLPGKAQQEAQLQILDGNRYKVPLTYHSVFMAILSAWGRPRAGRLYTFWVQQVYLSSCEVGLAPLVSAGERVNLLKTGVFCI